MKRSPAEVKFLVAAWLADDTTVKSLLAEDPGLAANLSPVARRQIAHAARNNNPAAVRVMLAAGWPVDSRGQHRGTPLHWAAFHRNVEMTRDILRYRPSLELTDADFQATPLGWAIHGSEKGLFVLDGRLVLVTQTLYLSSGQLQVGARHRAFRRDPARQAVLSSQA